MKKRKNERIKKEYIYNAYSVKSNGYQMKTSQNQDVGYRELMPTIFDNKYIT